MSDHRPRTLDPDTADRETLLALLADLDCDAACTIDHDATTVDLCEALREHVAWREEQARREALHDFAGRIGNDATRATDTAEEIVASIQDFIAGLEDHARGNTLWRLLERMGASKAELNAARNLSTTELEATVFASIDLYAIHLPKMFAIVAEAAGGEACVRALDTLLESIPEEWRPPFLAGLAKFVAEQKP